MANATFNETALEFLRIYYACHPGKLPEDEEKAFKEMSRMFGVFKKKLIDRGFKKNEDFFSDKF